MAHEHHDSHSHGSDRSAAYLGLIIGAIALFIVLRSIVAITNAHYNNEKPAATATK